MYVYGQYVLVVDVHCRNMYMYIVPALELCENRCFEQQLTDTVNIHVLVHAHALFL